MNLKTLKKIRRQLEEMRKSPRGRSAGDFESIANKLGRYKDPRGKEPNYVRERDPALSPPLSIPGHPGDIKIGTSINIIDALLSDVDDWEIFLQEAEDDNNSDDSTD